MRTERLLLTALLAEFPQGPPAPQVFEGGASIQLMAPNEGAFTDRRKLVVDTDRVEYSALSETLSEGAKYFVGVFDSRSNSLKLHAVSPPFHLEQRVKNYEGEVVPTHTPAEGASGRQRLVDKFAGRRAKTITQRRNENRLVEAHTLGSIKHVDQALEALHSRDRGDRERPDLPPYDVRATKPEKAYDLRSCAFSFCSHSLSFYSSH